jgi:hypothetical protein
MPIPQLILPRIGISSEIEIPYRKVGVDYTNRSCIDSHVAPWEGPVTLERVAAFLEKSGLDVAANGIVFAAIRPRQELINTKPSGFDRIISRVHANTVEYLVYLPGCSLHPNGKIKKTHPQKEYGFAEERLFLIEEDAPALVA